MTKTPRARPVWSTTRRLLRLRRLVSRVPARYRRPETVLRLTLIVGCLWFAVLFALLSRGGSGPPLTTITFALAAGAGITGAICASVSQHRWSATLLVVMLATGQLTAVAQQI
ncbi:MAG: hypothetical protein ACR2QE_19600 [Acidimicrobiales bacterium]